MAKKNDFLHFPAENFCTTIMSFGMPHAGKTWLLLNSLRYWLSVGMFEHYYLVLPQYKYEMEGSYDFLADPKYDEYVTIFESYHESKCVKIIADQQKNRELYRSGKIKEMPRVFFCIDDATGQGSSLFKSKTLTRFVTENRHIFIHSWFLLHYDKGIVEPKVRNIMWVVLYPLKRKLLEGAYDSYVDYPEFKEFDSFEEYYDKKVRCHEHGFLLMRTRGKYNPNACNWFK